MQAKQFSTLINEVLQVWVYRFVIKQGVEMHNALLNNFTI